MDGLRSEFGSPEFQTEQDALNKFKSASEGVNAYTATVDRLAVGTFFYQCVYLLLHPTAEVQISSPLHASSPTEEEKSAAQEKLHDSINSLSVLISRLELWKTNSGYTVLCT
ncbi:Cyclic phosphodiesterase [Linum perenne]